MTVPSAAVVRLQRQLTAVLLLRQALRDFTAFAIAWGVIALVMRTTNVTRISTWSVAALLPLVFIISAVRAMRQLPSRTALVALTDAESHCGGLLIAAETTELGEWRERLRATAPPIRWNARRPLTFASVALLFALAALLVPQRVATAAHRSLDIASGADHVATQLQTLEEEKLLPPERVDAMQQSLEQLRRDASGDDPAKAWETLDSLAEAASRAGAEAAESSLQKTEQLSRAEATASVLEGGALDAGDLAAGMRELAAQIEKLDPAALGALSPELKEALKKGTISSEQLRQIAGAARAGKEQLRKTLDKLRAAGLIDAKTLARQEALADAGDRDALSAYLKEHSKKRGFGTALAEWSKGRGGVDRGRGDAPMFFGEKSDAAGAKFKPGTLPATTAAAMRSSALVGMSAAAPDAQSSRVSQGGALNGAAAGAGSAFTPEILPRHRGAVKRFFERKTQ